MNSPLHTTKTVLGSPIIGALATTNGDCDYVSLKGYEGCLIKIFVDNATTVTGGAVTLKQATDVAATGGEKALSFAKMWANTDAAAGDTLTETAVTSDTFTTSTTDNKNLVYVVDVKASDLDVANGFDCLRVDVLLMANAVGAVVYELYGARYASTAAVSAITD